MKYFIVNLMILVFWGSNSNVYFMDSDLPKFTEVLSHISIVFDPLEFSILVTRVQILETIEIWNHPKCMVDSC
jgi:hypothetical protein